MLLLNGPFSFKKRVALPYRKVIQISLDWVFIFNYFSSFISHFLNNLPLRALCKEGLNILTALATTPIFLTSGDFKIEKFDALLITFYSKLCFRK